MIISPASFNLQSAINACPAGGTVTIPAGSYGPIVIPRAMTLYANAGVVIQGGTQTVQINASNVTLSGSARVTGASNTGIYCWGSYSGITVSGWTADHCGDFGIVMYGVSNITIQDFVGHDFGSNSYPPHAIYLRNCETALIQRCEGYNVGYVPYGSGGVDLASSHNVVMTDCYMHDNQGADDYGFIAEGSTTVTFANCRGANNSVADFYQCALGSGSATYVNCVGTKRVWG